MTSKHITILLIALVFSLNVSGQITMPKVAPISPTASSLYKFTDYPVSLHTGLVDISVPIYTVKAAGVEIPIELKYHASGITYSDVSRNVGLGWTLMAGGMVTAQQMGVEDGIFPGFFKLAADIVPEQTETGTNIPTDREDNDNHKLIEIAKGLRDSEYDMYSYSFLNYSGKFFYPGTTDPVFSPRRNLKVIPGTYGGSGMYAKIPFTILDEEGVAYRFGMDRNNVNVSETPFGILPTNVNLLLTEIVSADKSDTVQFKYTFVSTESNSHLNGRMVIDDHMILFDNLERRGYDGTLPSDYRDGYGVSFQGFNYERLDEIIFKGGRVAFTYNISHQLTAINVYSNTSSRPIKIVSVLQSVFTTEHFKLDEVKFQNAGATKSYSYKFDYNGVPWPKKSGIDYWGYYNGVDESSVTATGYVPNFTWLNSSYPAIGAAYRNPNESAMLQGMLTKVTYPTGGSSVFTYEAHRYGLGQIAGGLRIKSVENFTATGVSAGQKWYKYGVGETGSGTLFRNVDPEDYYYTFQNEGLLGPAAPAGVTYILREKRYDPFPIISNMSSLGSSVTYDQVTEYTGDGTTANGKSVYTYESFMDNTYGSPNPMNGRIPMTYRSNAWKSGNLLSKAVYRQDGALLSKTTNVYKDMNYTEYPCLKVMQYLNWVDYGQSTASYMTREQTLEYFLTRAPLFGITWGSGGTLVLGPDSTLVIDSFGIYLHSPYSYANYLLSSGIRVLDYSTELQDGVTRTTTYTYDATYDKPRTITTTQSDGVSTIKKLTYTFDKTGEPYTTMVSRNMLTQVEESTYKGIVDAAHHLQSTKTDYSFWASGQPTSTVTNQIYPRTVYSKRGTDAYEPRLEYAGYDGSGNILSARKTGGAYTSYLWGYDKQYPVAEVTNAAVKDVFFESFEEGLDNSAYNDAKAGRYSRIGGFSKELTGLTAGSYLLSYWSKAGSAWVYNATGVTVSGSNYTISLSGQVDDVRFHPQGAHMVTYTYDRQVGQTSIMDAKNDATYFVYDDFGQLMYIKDRDRNVTKGFCYNYAGQVVSCFGPESPPPFVVYARLDRSTPVNSTTGDPQNEHWTNRSATYQINFYRNAQGTIPLILPVNMSMRIKESYYNYHAMLGTGDSGEYINTYAADAGLNNKNIGNLILDTHHYYFDSEYQNNYDDYYLHNYTLVPDSESNYIILTPSY